MASSYKYFSENDRIVATNQLVETLLTNKFESSAGSGLYIWLSQSNSPHYFTEIYSDATLIGAATEKQFDITFGRSSQTPNDSVYSSFDGVKKNIYNQYAKMLLGLSATGTPINFNLNPDDASGTKALHNAYFINFSRSKFKDRIKQGSFILGIKGETGISGQTTPELLLKDVDSSGNSTIRECRTGFYGLLFATSSDAAYTIVNDNIVQGLVFYEAGIAVVSPYIYSQYGVSNANPSSSNAYIENNVLGLRTSTVAQNISGSREIEYLIVTGSIRDEAHAFGNSLLTASYTPITEINSTVYFCRAYNNEFNYSSNPTYLSASQIYVKDGDPEIPPRSYITTVGLYSDDNQLLAVAKLSEPILKTPENELIARVRLDF